jgi:hypothetical protein
MEKEKVGAFIRTVSEDQIWNGPFVLPSDGRITTGYGLQRYYNGVFADQYVMMTNLLQTLFTVWSGDEKLGFTVLA